MWQAQIQATKTDQIQHVTLWQDSRQLCFSEVIDLWQSQAQFRSLTSTLLAGSPFAAFFWEMPPITQRTLDRAYECVLVNSPSLSQISTDPEPFRSHFARADSDQGVITFANLSGDALLVVPCPQVEAVVYADLARFVRGAPVQQQDRFWQTLAQVITQHLGPEPTWISTSGLGVHWLHVRLDSRPKYYTYDPYTRFYKDL